MSHFLRTILEGKSSTHICIMSAWQTHRLRRPEHVLKCSDAAVKAYHFKKRVGDYLIGHCIGKGSFARVYEGMHMPTGEKVAMKVVSKERCLTDDYMRRYLRREGTLLQKIRHPNVIQVLEIIETTRSYYVALELCTGGGIIEHVERQGRLSEETARRYFRHIVSAVECLHKMGIIHRDLKVDNLLLAEDGNVKIIDFGLSTQITEGMMQVSRTSNRTATSSGQKSKLHIAVSDQPSPQRRVTNHEEKEIRGVDTEFDEKLPVHAKYVTIPMVFSERLYLTQCGSPAYTAPEIINKRAYGLQSDLWSMGVNLYAMLVGQLPFTVYPFSLNRLVSKMMNKDMNPFPSDLSSLSIDLINRLLIPDPNKRLRLAEVIQHPWMKYDSNQLETNISNNAQEKPTTARQSASLKRKPDGDGPLKSPELSPTEFVEEVYKKQEHLLRHLLQDHLHNLLKKYEENQENAAPTTVKKKNISGDQHSYMYEVENHIPGRSNATYCLLKNKAKRYCQNHHSSIENWLETPKKQEVCTSENSPEKLYQPKTSGSRHLTMGTVVGGTGTTTHLRQPSGKHSPQKEPGANRNACQHKQGGDIDTSLMKVRRAHFETGTSKTEIEALGNNKLPSLREMLGNKSKKLFDVKDTRKRFVMQPSSEIPPTTTASSKPTIIKVLPKISSSAKRPQNDVKVHPKSAIPGKIIPPLMVDSRSHTRQHKNLKLQFSRVVEMDIPGNQRYVSSTQTTSKSRTPRIFTEPLLMIKLPHPSSFETTATQTEPKRSHRLFSLPSFARNQHPHHEQHHSTQPPTFRRVLLPSKPITIRYSVLEKTQSHQMCNQSIEQWRFYHKDGAHRPAASSPSTLKPWLGGTNRTNIHHPITKTFTSISHRDSMGK